jgi:putative ABC transport system ATP-binding protein
MLPTGLAPASAEPGGPRSEHFVEVRDVFKIYKEGASETVALRGANLVLPRGEFASLIGPSGSGKTTLLSILAGLSLPSGGRVWVGLQDLTELDEEARAGVRAASIGLVFQSGNLVPFLTAEENVALTIRGVSRHVASQQARELLRELGLDERRRHWPRQLSGGEAQRVAIAVALANGPELLLGDEVTGELDSETAETVMEMLLTYQRDRGVTFLLVTHNPSVAGLADRQLEIVDGLVSER